MPDERWQHGMNGWRVSVYDIAPSVPARLVGREGEVTGYSHAGCFVWVVLDGEEEPAPVERGAPRMTPQPHPGQGIDRYEAGARCGNCGYDGPVTAPVGEYVYQQPCPLCACLSLLPTARRDWEHAPHKEPTDA